MTDQKKFKIVLLKEESDLIVVSVSCTPRVPKGPRIRYDIGEIVSAIREEYPNVGDYIFGATLINYYPNKTEAQFGFKTKKKMLLLEDKGVSLPFEKKMKKKNFQSLDEIVRPFSDLQESTEREAE